MVSHLLLELLQGTAQTGRARRRADAEHARRRAAVELEQDAERHHLPLAGRELGERGKARPGSRANAHPRRPRAHRRVHAPFYVAGVRIVTETRYVFLLLFD